MEVLGGSDVEILAAWLDELLYSRKRFEMNSIALKPIGVFVDVVSSITVDVG